MPRKSKRSMSASERWKTVRNGEPTAKVKVTIPDEPTGIPLESIVPCQTKVMHTTVDQGHAPLKVTAKVNTSKDDTNCPVQATTQSKPHPPHVVPLESQVSSNRAHKTQPDQCCSKASSPEKHIVDIKVNQPTIVKVNVGVSSTVTKHSSCTINQTQLFPEEESVQASYSQNNQRYSTPNTQCTANSAVFLAFLHENENLTTSDLNLILDRGDTLYQTNKYKLNGKFSYMAADDVNGEFVQGKTHTHELIMRTSVSGCFKDVPNPASPALQESLTCLRNEVQYALLIMHGLTTAVFRDHSGKYGFFDAHARDKSGFCHGDNADTAVMIKFRQLSKMIDRIVAIHDHIETEPSSQYELVQFIFQSQPLIKIAPPRQPVSMITHISGPSQDNSQSQPTASCTTSMFSYKPPDNVQVSGIPSGVPQSRSCTMNQTQRHFPQEEYVQAHYSQNNRKYRLPNIQCTANSAAFLAFLHENENLTGKDLDLILDTGDRLYHKINNTLPGTRRNGFLAAEDLDRETVQGKTHTHLLYMHTALCGYFKHVPNPAYPALKERLNCLRNEVQYALLLMCNLTIAVFRDNSGRFGIFDPHPRTSNGFSGGDTAVMIRFTQLNNMIDRIIAFHNNIKTKGGKQYDLVPVIFQSEPMTPLIKTVPPAQPVSMIKQMPDPSQHHSESQPAASCSKSMSLCKPANTEELITHVDLTVSEASSSTANKTQSHVTTVESNVDVQHLPVFKDSTEQPKLHIGSLNTDETTGPCVSKTVQASVLTGVNKRSKHARRKYMKRSLEQNKATKSTADKRQEKYKQKIENILTRYHSDTAFRDNVKSSSKLRYSIDQSIKQRQRTYIQTRSQEDPNFKIKRKKYFQERYKDDENLKQTKKKYIQNKYRDDADFKLRQKNYIQNKYRNDAEFKLKQNKYIQNKYRDDAKFKLRQRNYIQNKYRDDAEFQLRQRNYIQNKYRDDAEFQLRQRNYIHNKYRNDAEFKLKQKKYIQNKYRDDAEFKLKQKKYIQNKYRNDADFKLKQRNYICNKYKTNPIFKQKHKAHIRQRYAENEAFRLRHKSVMREMMHMKYKCNYESQVHHKMRCATNIKKKYRELTRQHIESSTVTQSEKKETKKDQLWAKSLHAFRAHCKSYPTFVCTVCFKASFENQVKRCKRSLYKINPHVVERCLTGRYVHICDNECLNQSCNVPEERKSEWICHTCHIYLKRGTMPALAAANNLELVDIPPELSVLNTAERHMVKRVISFQRVVILPKGKQRAIKGNVVLVPSEVEEVVNTLPRVIGQSQTIRIKIKRKQCYKGHYIMQTVNWPRVVRALEVLKETSPCYQDIKINHDQELCDPTLQPDNESDSDDNMRDGDFNNADLMEIDAFEKNALCDAKSASNDGFDHEMDIELDNQVEMNCDSDDDMEVESNKDKHNDSKNPVQDSHHHMNDIHSEVNDNKMETQSHDQINEMDSEHDNHESVRDSNNNDNNDYDTQQGDDEANKPRGGVAFESCLQPLDISEEVLCHNDSAYCIAPAEKNSPISFFKTPNLESKAFPVQFPTGVNTFDAKRPIKLTPSRYFKSRLFNVDNRFASDTEYLFMAQYVIEIHMARSNMSIQLRKAKPFTRDGRKITAEMLRDQKEVEKLISHRDVLRFMITLRGTPPYHHKNKLDLYAIVRTIGPPTYFVTFSAAELSHWPEFVEAIKAQQGEIVKFEDLDWETKTEILRSNAVTTMRMFDKRVEGLFKYLINSPAQPLGKVEDYYYRIEFQARGSPHVHALIWTADKIDIEDEQKFCEIVDKYISTTLPDPHADPELYKLVCEVQMHSKNHTKTCHITKTKGCRFGFPQCPVEETMITTPETCEKVSKESMKKLKSFKTLLHEPQSSCQKTEEILSKCEMTMEEYEQCLHGMSKSPKVFYKRDPKDVWVNNHNVLLLKAWKANMDIQPVTGVYPCIQYVCGYISKSEAGMTEHLNSVVKNTGKERLNESDEMKEVMQAYSKSREVSAQECVARACGLRLKGCTRQVVYMPTDTSVKMSKPMSQLQECDDDKIWMTNALEKYRARPETPEFEDMCFGDFLSMYRLVYGKEVKGKHVKPLLNGLGYVKKLRKNHIFRPPRPSQLKNPEEFYRTLLTAYLPHRGRFQLKPPGFPTFKSFYEGGCVRLPYADEVVAVKSIVDENLQKYEKYGRAVDDAVADVEKNSEMVDAWCNLAPESERERLECLAERQARESDDDNVQENDPDLLRRSNVRDATFIMEPPKLDHAYRQQLYQSLNQMQASVFYSVRDWCIERVEKQNPEPFFLYINGGAGTGKSHLIKSIHAEASEILCKVERHAFESDPLRPTVLLAAFTGTAAFNICGTTLHTLFKLPRNYKNMKDGLGNKLDEMRAELMEAEILIIDEISMVSVEIFECVHRRLQSIKGSTKPFGGMSVLAVGDFYQLPPVKGHPLCTYANLSLWRDNFTMVTLTEIMRQKDDVAFAETLNHIRVKHKTHNLSEADRALLQQAVTEPDDCPHNVLHLFATKRFVHAHNSQTLAKLHDDIITVQADDYRKEAQTGRMQLQSKPCKGDFSGLDAKLQLAIGAPVMLTRNINLSEGLVNGAFAKLAAFVYSSTNPTHVEKLGLDLDKKRSSNKSGSDNLVYVERCEETEQNSCVRRQFPIKLAYACTIHKVQGLTTSSAVVSLKRIFNPGMGYVALSRVTSLSGLRIIHLDESKLYADPEITHSLNNMQTANLDHIMPFYQVSQTLDRDTTFSVIHHNTQGLPSHIQDIQSHHELCLSDVLCFTETRLQCFVAPALHLDGYTMYERSRHVSYTHISEMANKEGGGVSIYIKNHIVAHEVRYVHNVTDLEFVVVQVEAPFCALIVTVYRPPTYSISSFLKNLTALLESLEMLEIQPIIVCGDFNENLLFYGTKPIMEMFQSKQYEQLITAATTNRHTLLDAIYISRPQLCTNSGVLRTYYSYHNPVFCVISIP